MGNGCLKSWRKEPRLSKEDLYYLLNNTGFNEQQIRQWHSSFLRDCPDGHLSRIQFLILYQSLFPRGKAGPFYDHVFRTFDEDGSGKIDFKEFLTGISITQSGKPADRLDLAFRLYDIDGSGTVEQSELAEIIKSLHLMMEPNKDPLELSNMADKKAEDIFQKVDINKDGSLSRQEFLDVCLKDSALYRLLASEDNNRK